MTPEINMDPGGSAAPGLSASITEMCQAIVSLSAQLACHEIVMERLLPHVQPATLARIFDEAGAAIATTPPGPSRTRAGTGISPETRESLLEHLAMMRSRAKL